MSRNKFVFLGLLAILLGYFLYATETRESPGQSKSSDAILFSADKISNLSSLRLTHSDREIALSRTGSGELWFLESPVRELAEQDVVEALLDSLSSLKVLNTIKRSEVEGAAKDFGFVDTKFSFSLEGTFPGSSFAQETWLYGGVVNISGRRYLMKVDKEGQEIKIIDGDLALSLMKDVFDFRNKRPVGFEVESIDSIVVKRGISVATIDKKLDGRWLYRSEEEEVLLDGEVIASKLKRWRGITVDEILDVGVTELSGLGLAPELLSISLQSGEKKSDKDPLRIYFGEQIVEVSESVLDSDFVSAEKHYYFRTNRADTVYRTELPSYREFLKPLHLLRDLTPFNDISGRILELSVSGTDVSGPASFNFSRSAWRNNDTNGDRGVDPRKIKKLLEVLKSLRVLTYLGKSGEGIPGQSFKEPTLEIVLGVTRQASQSALEEPSSKEIEKVSLIFGGSVTVAPGSGSNTPKDSESSTEDSPDYALVDAGNGKLVPAVIAAGEKSKLLNLLRSN